MNTRSGSLWLIGGSVLLAVPTSLEPDRAVAGLTYLAGMVLIVVALWWAALRLRGPSRGPWILIAAAGTCWLGGDLVEHVSPWLGHTEGGVGLPDLFWLASYPLLIAGVVRMIRMRAISAALLRDIGLDVAVVSAAASVVASFLIINPALENGGEPLQSVVDSLYPLGDIALFALAITLMLTPGSRGGASRLLIATLGLSLPLDLLQAILPVIDPSFDGAHLDGIQLVVNALLGAAAIHASRRDTARQAEPSGKIVMSRWRVVLLGASLCAVSIAGSTPGASPQARLEALAASILVSVAVLFRFYRLMHEREEAEVALTFQVNHDQLTGLANRFLLMRRFADALNSNTGSVEGPVIAWVDLDGFKLINDRWGHAVGDEVIRTIARRLNCLVRESDTVARMGGDEFVVLCGAGSAWTADELGLRICEAVGHGIKVGAVEVTVGASVGVVAAEPRTPRTTADDLLLIDELLHRADLAMFEAKRAGGGLRIAGALSVAASERIPRTLTYPVETFQEPAAVIEGNLTALCETVSPDA